MTTATIQRSPVETPAHAGEAPVQPKLEVLWAIPQDEGEGWMTAAEWLERVSPLPAGLVVPEPSGEAIERLIEGAGSPS